VALIFVRGIIYHGQDEPMNSSHQQANFLRNMKDRDTKRYAQKETVTATGTEGNAQRNNISRNSLTT